MIAVRMMEMVADAVIDMVAVRHGLVAAAGTVNMARLVPAAAVVGGALLGVVARHRDHVLVHMILVRVMQMAVVQIVDMPVMVHRVVAAARAVPVIVRRMGAF
jgi:hypothetical protein